VVKPTDMVWKEGMTRWVRAASVRELFPNTPVAAGSNAAAKAADQHERARFEQAAQSGGGSVLLVALLGAGVLVFALVVGIIILVVMVRSHDPLPIAAPQPAEPKAGKDTKAEPPQKKETRIEPPSPVEAKSGNDIIRPAPLKVDFGKEHVFR